jgi:hypothetical protein
MTKLQQNRIVGRKGDKFVRFRNLVEDHLSLEEEKVILKQYKK